MNVGTTLGPYRVLGKLGEGGMGEVYRATDTKLKRDVAIKVLPESFADDPERLARFQREAEVLASLNHPNIAAIYGLEDSGETHALVLELVEGPTLQDRIAQGAIPLDEALPIAKQIAEALEAAHEQGIIHRDLKPANIKVTPDGVVKVLDFGLARAMGVGVHGASGGAPVDAPTMTRLDHPPSPGSGGPADAAATKAGMVLGTPAYMSPEQATASPVDRRADAWAFGALLYEMLTGHQAFAASNISETLTAVLTREIDWSALPPETPVSIRKLLRRCLARDRRRRLADMSTARLEIDEALLSPAGDTAESGVPLPAAPSGRPRVGLVAAVVIATLVSGTLAWYLKPSATSSADATGGAARFLIGLSESMSATDGVLVISRDGRRVAYAAGPADRQQLFIREIDQFASRVVPDTEGVVSAAFSPDGQSLVFVAERKLQTVSLSGGTALTLRDRVDGAGVTWTADQTILYNPGTATGIWRIPAAGGEAVAVTQPGGKDNEQRFPELLPDGSALLFSARGGVTDDEVYVESLETHERRQLVKGSAPHYLTTGHLVFVQAGTLFAVPFDADHLETTGAPVVLIEGIRQARSGQPLISYSEVGSIVYAPTDAEPGSNALVWVDHAGVEGPSTGATGRPYAQPRLALDMRRVVTSLRGNPEDLWLLDLARGTSSRLTTESNTSFPVWTPDGRRITLASAKEGAYDIYWRPVDGSAPEEQLLSGSQPKYPFSWSPDGTVLAFVSVSPTTLQDIRVLRADRRDASEPFLETQFREGGPVFSPDGQWIAYVSDESGRFEVYVRPFPGPGEKWPISVGGGNEPVWPRNGHQLFYRAGDAMMAVDVETRPAFSAGKPRKLFEGAYERSLALWPNFDASPDGQQLLMVKPENPSPAASHINVVLNWVEELTARVPVP